MKKRIKSSRIMLYIFVVIAVAFTLTPVLFIVSNSFMSGVESSNRYTSEITPINMQNLNNGEIHFVEFGFLPTVLTFASYAELLLNNPLYMRLFWNSVLIVVPVVIGQILISVPAAFAFEYAKFKYKEVFYVLYIIVLMLPMQVLLVPHYIIANLIGTNNTLLAIILPALFNPFGVFLIRQQLKGFQYECIEAARVEGANNWHLFMKIVLPNLAPIVASLSILTFAEYWNVVDQAVVFLKNPNDEPLSAYLSYLIQGDGGMVFTTSAFYLFPAIIVFMIGQEYLAKGISLSVVVK